MRITLTSEDLSKHFGDQISDEVHSTLIEAYGINPTVYAWSIIVDIDESEAANSKEMF
jgi:hypothetical protein